MMADPPDARTSYCYYLMQEVSKFLEEQLLTFMEDNN